MTRQPEMRNLLRLRLRVPAAGLVAIGLVAAVGWARGSRMGSGSRVEVQPQQTRSAATVEEDSREAPAEASAFFEPVILADPIVGAGPSGIVPDELGPDTPAVDSRVVRSQAPAAASAGVPSLPRASRDSIAESSAEAGVAVLPPLEEASPGRTTSSAGTAPDPVPRSDSPVVDSRSRRTHGNVVPERGPEPLVEAPRAVAGSKGPVPPVEPASVSPERDPEDVPVEGESPVVLAPDRGPGTRREIPGEWSARSESSTRTPDPIDIGYGAENSRQAARSADPARVLSDVRMETLPDRTVIEIVLDGIPDYRIHRESDPERVVVEFPGVEDAWRRGSLLVGRSFVVRVRVEELSGGSRAVLETIRPVDFTLTRTARGLSLELALRP